MSEYNDEDYDDEESMNDDECWNSMSWDRGGNESEEDYNDRIRDLEDFLDRF